MPQRALQERSNQLEIGYEALSATVVLLRIEIFSKAATILPMVEEYRDAIESSELLLVDLRGNAGGDEIAYEPLMEFRYSGPYKIAGTEVLATEDNASAWERYIPFGSNSAGVLDYGNVRFAMLPSKSQYLVWPTTRSRRLPSDAKDGVGFPPDVPIDSNVLRHLDGEAMAQWLVDEG